MAVWTKFRGGKLTLRKLRQPFVVPHNRALLERMWRRSAATRGYAHRLRLAMFVQFMASAYHNRVIVNEGNCRALFGIPGRTYHLYRQKLTKQFLEDPEKACPLCMRARGMMAARIQELERELDKMREECYSKNMDNRHVGLGIVVGGGGLPYFSAALVREVMEALGVSGGDVVADELVRRFIEAEQRERAVERAVERS